MMPPELTEMTAKIELQKAAGNLDAFYQRAGHGLRENARRVAFEDLTDEEWENNINPIRDLYTDILRFRRQMRGSILENKLSFHEFTLLERGLDKVYYTLQQVEKLVMIQTRQLSEGATDKVSGNMAINLIETSQDILRDIKTEVTFQAVEAEIASEKEASGGAKERGRNVFILKNES